jgi:hypothetical protein
LHVLLTNRQDREARLTAGLFVCHNQKSPLPPHPLSPARTRRASAANSCERRRCVIAAAASLSANTRRSASDSTPQRPATVFDLDQCSFLFMSAFKAWGAGLSMEVMTMQIDNKGESLNANLWAEMSLMMALVVVLLAVFWQFL